LKPIRTREVTAATAAASGMIDGDRVVPELLGVADRFELVRVHVRERPPPLGRVAKAEHDSEIDGVAEHAIHHKPDWAGGRRPV
jgi:hypothetical protein